MIMKRVSTSSDGQKRDILEMGRESSRKRRIGVETGKRPGMEGWVYKNLKVTTCFLGLFAKEMTGN